MQRLKAAEDAEAFARFEAVRTDTVEIKIGDATLRVSASIDPALLSGIVRAVGNNMVIASNGIRHGYKINDMNAGVPLKKISIVRLVARMSTCFRIGLNGKE